MAAILTTCPTLGDAVATGQHATKAEWATGAPEGGRFRCRSCNGVHAWIRENAWLSGGLVDWVRS